VSALYLDRRHLLAALSAGTLAALARTKADAQGLQKLSLIIGTSPPDPACHFLYYGREKGFYKETGIDIDISGVTSATNATRAVVAGVADVGWVDSSSSILAKDSGARIKCLSGFAAKLDYQMVGTKDITSMTGLAGKRFGVATIGGGTFIIPRVMIEKAGGKPDDTQWVAIGNSAARVQALIADKIDATITTTSFVPRLLSYGRFAKFGDAGKELPDMVYCWEITSDKALAEKRAALAGFVAATSKAVRWAEANPDEAVALSVALLPDAPKDEIATGIKTYLAQHFWSADPIVTKAQVDFTAETLRKTGQIRKPFPAEDFLAQGLSRS
jgi:NitT/TauT family transport system substrate-binding protein